jgi:hypothetical protein
VAVLKLAAARISVAVSVVALVLVALGMLAAASRAVAVLKLAAARIWVAVSVVALVLLLERAAARVYRVVVKSAVRPAHMAAQASANVSTSDRQPISPADPRAETLQSVPVAVQT